MNIDVENKAPVAVLTEYGARRLLATEHTIGQTLRIGGDSFEVVGIVRSEGGQAGNIQIPVSRWMLIFRLRWPANISETFRPVLQPAHANGKR